MAHTNHIARNLYAMKHIIALLLCVFTFQLAQGQDTEPTVRESTKKKVSIIRPSTTPSDSIISNFNTSLDSLATTSMLIDSTAIVADTLVNEIQVSTFDPDAMRAVY